MSSQALQAHLDLAGKVLDDPPALLPWNRSYSPGSNGEDCADLSTSMKFGTDVDQNILNSFFDGAEAGAQWGYHICQIQDGHLPLFDSIITL